MFHGCFAGSALFMVRKILDQSFDHRFDARAAFGVERAAIGVRLREDEGLECDVVILAERMLPEEWFGEARRLIRIRSEREQIKAFLLRERRPIAEQDVEKFESLDVATEHGNAQCQWSRQQKANRSPNPRPECCCNDHRDGRKTDAVAVKEWLDELSRDRFEDEIEGR